MQAHIPKERTLRHSPLSRSKLWKDRCVPQLAKSCRSEGSITSRRFRTGPVPRNAGQRSAIHRPFDFAASFERYEFRTVKSSSEPPVRLGADVLDWPPGKL